MKNIQLITTAFGYNFWRGFSEDGKAFYNVTPQDQQKPEGGYMSAEYICNIKGVPNLFADLN